MSTEVCKDYCKLRDLKRHPGISPAIVGQLCRDPKGLGASWQSCLCSGPDGSKSAECPLQATDMPSAFYLLAAPKEELVGLLSDITWNRYCPRNTNLFFQFSGIFSVNLV